MDYLLDTNAVIYLQQGRLLEPLPVGFYGISVITEMELLSFTGLDETQTAWLKKFIGAVTSIQLDVKVKDRAIQLRRENRLKIPDAIIVASALVCDVALVTYDRELVGLPDLRLHSIKLKMEREE